MKKIIYVYHMYLIIFSVIEIDKNSKICKIPIIWPNPCYNLYSILTPLPQLFPRLISNQTTVGENIHGAPKMRYNYGAAIQLYNFLILL